MGRLVVIARYIEGNFYDEISEAPVIFVHVSNISFSGINTSYIERINLTVRNSLARFIRKGMNY
ncbi:MAG: hypothetical protein K8R25_07365, partial [Methanosarcinales archaeon]|nr:hypothetical protein [Methanosarcinales archaeon]